MVAREAAEDAAEERCAAGASIIGRAAEMALRLLRGCRASEGTTGTAAAGGLEIEAIVTGGVDAGIEEAKAWAETTGWVYMLRVDTEVAGCRGTGMSMGTRRYSCAAIWSRVERWLGSG